MKYKAGDVVVCVDKGVPHEGYDAKSPYRHGFGWELGKMFTIERVSFFIGEKSIVLWPVGSGSGVYDDAVESEPVAKLYNKLRKEVEKELA